MKDTQLDEKKCQECTKLRVAGEKVEHGKRMSQEKIGELEQLVQTLGENLKGVEDERAKLHNLK